MAHCILVLLLCSFSLLIVCICMYVSMKKGRTPILPRHLSRCNSLTPPPGSISLSAHMICYFVKNITCSSSFLPTCFPPTLPPFCLIPSLAYALSFFVCRLHPSHASTPRDPQKYTRTYTHIPCLYILQVLALFLFSLSSRVWSVC